MRCTPGWTSHPAHRIIRFGCGAQGGAGGRRPDRRLDQRLAVDRPADQGLHHRNWVFLNPLLHPDLRDPALGDSTVATASLISIVRTESETKTRIAIMHELLYATGLEGDSTAPESIMQAYVSFNISFLPIGQHGILAPCTGHGTWAANRPQLQGLMLPIPVCGGGDRQVVAGTDGPEGGYGGVRCGQAPQRLHHLLTIAGKAWMVRSGAVGTGKVAEGSIQC